MNWEELVIRLLQLGMFAAFINAIVEVIKGVSAIGVWGIVKEVFRALWKDKPLSPGTMRTLSFLLAVLYCKAFAFGAMSSILMIKIAPDNSFAWTLDYIGTASVVYVGVDIFYGWLKNVKTSLQNGNGAIKTLETITTKDNP